MGGRPSKQTPADKRLKANKPAAPQAAPKVTPVVKRGKR